MAWIAYLLALLAAPLLAYWRWGLVASLAITVVGLGLVVLVFHVMSVNHLLDVPDLGQPPAQSPMEQIRRSQAAGYVLAYVMVVIPGMAVLLGGALSVVWSIVAAAWRAFARGDKAA